MRWFSLSAAALLALFVPISGRAQSFTIQQVMSAPFNEHLIAAPVAHRFAWVANQQGRRNLWLAEPGAHGAWTSRELTHYDADDGQQIDQLAWTPDGNAILYVRGGDFESPEKPAPNPALIPSGVEQDIWAVPASGGEPRKVAEGREPVISPDGGTVAYILKDQVWTQSLRDPSAKPAQLFHGRGREGSLAWSPDGKWLAFRSGRDDHGFIGVYSFEQNSLRYLDPSTQQDQLPVWSPDSTRIAFIRIPPDTSGIDFKPRREAQPWSIRVASPRTGQGREVWRAHPGPGSVFHEAEGDRQLLWAAGDRLIFPWEGDGWTHIYTIPLTGGSAQLLTPGSFEAEDLVLSHDRGTVFYCSNQDDIDRRHLWRVPAAGGAPVQLTRGQGIEISPIPAPDGTLALLRADARIPIRPAILARESLTDLAPQLIPAEFPSSKLVVPQQVIFNAADGMQIHGQLFLPPDSQAAARHPAVVFFHGGSRRQMLLGWQTMEYYSNAYAMNQYLASLGYVVLSVNYRSGIGYGLNFREALNFGAAGASEFNDVLGAGLYLRARPDVEADKIGVWGGSYGGYLTALALARASDLFAAGVDLHGVHDWNLELTIWQPRYNPDSDLQAARVAWESSPLASIQTWRSPVLLMQGDDDRNVQFAQTVRLAAALRQHGIPFEEHIFPDEIHDFLLHRTWIAAYQYGADFFNRKLGR